ncbi:MAG: ribosome-binding factor A [Candidatus Gracilibacteria bacterium]|nr:ribosome-binding factor A [Candidatus Gracilibacteria bacterium]
MSTKTDRFAENILEITSPILLEYIREHGEEFGIVSIVKVIISKDRSYADIFVSATSHEDMLPKKLAPLADRLRHDIGRQIQTYKIPQIRFKRIKNEIATRSVQDIINELSKQYGLDGTDAV